MCRRGGRADRQTDAQMENRRPFPSLSPWGAEPRCRTGPLPRGLFCGGTMAGTLPGWWHGRGAPDVPHQAPCARAAPWPSQPSGLPTLRPPRGTPSPETPHGSFPGMATRSRPPSKVLGPGSLPCARLLSRGRGFCLPVALPAATRVAPGILHRSESRKFAAFQLQPKNKKVWEISSK